MNVYVVRFYSTNELWLMVVCATLRAAQKICREHGMVCASDELYYNPNDKSQKATIAQKLVIEDNEA